MAKTKVRLTVRLSAELAQRLNVKRDLVDQAEHEVMRERLRHLKCCTMLPGSFDKRFIDDIWQKDPAKLTVKQHDFVMVLAWRYRRQMPSELVPKECPNNQAAQQSKKERARTQ